MKIGDRMYLDFSNRHIKNFALNMNQVDYDNGFNSVDAFLVVLSGVDFETINLLCSKVAATYMMDPHTVYMMIQKREGKEPFKKFILETAYNLIHSGQPLGTKVLHGNHNASSWIMHSLFEGEVAAEFARMLNLSPDVAMKLGLLHDIGRKFDHSIEHTIKGFEYLAYLGLTDEAFCTLTHTFLSVPENGAFKGQRCANCDPAIEGFYVDENGKGTFQEGSKMDDVSEFLESYKYNIYDRILNISDLMATSRGIISPYDRMLDVYSRKAPDPKNEEYFKVCFINSLNELMYEITHDQEFNKTLNINDLSSKEELEKLLMETSDVFMKRYLVQTSFREYQNPVQSLYH